MYLKAAPALRRTMNSVTGGVPCVRLEGRQGPGGRTHLMSPAMAAAAAVSGCIADVREVAR